MKFSKILIILGIGCVAGLLLVFGVKLQAQNRPNRDAIMAKMGELNADSLSQMAQFRNHPQVANWGSRTPSNREESKENTDFYRTIVDNNIFRPLGWRPPNKEPEYSFISTHVGVNGAKSKATIHERRSNKSYYASIGDKVGDAVVKDIKAKEIILDKDGENITLRRERMMFLNSRSSSRSSSRPDNRDESADNNRSSSRSKRDSEAKAKAAAEAKMKEAMERAMQMRRRFEGNRERMIQEFRSRGGYRGRR